MKIIFTAIASFMIIIVSSVGSFVSASPIPACDAPVFTACPSNQTANTAAGTCAATVSYTATATGDPVPTVTYTFTGATTASGNGTGSGSTFNKGVTNVVITASNGCGPDVTCSFTVTVIDNQPPSITCPANVTINTPPCQSTATTTLTPPTVNDNCAGSFGNALNFDGTNDFVFTPTIALANTGITCEAWINPTTGGSFLRLFDNQYTTSFFFGLNGGGLSVWLANSSVASGGTFTTGVWQHVAFTYDPSITTNNVKIYLNGNVVGTGSFNGSINLTALIHIGSYQGTGNFFNGSMDEVRVWNTVRTDAQILANMNSEITAQAGLVVYYNLNQGIAGGTNTGVNTATDLSGNSNTGSLANFALSGPVSNWVGSTTPGTIVTNNAPATYPTGNTTVTWTVTDQSGNTATCDQVVTVVPVFNTYYQDADGDGNGNPAVTFSGCSPPAGYIATGGDCDDNNAAIYPAANDASFNPGTGATIPTGVNAMALQTDGKIIIGGSFTTYNGTSAIRLARINTDGTLDNSFTVGTGANSIVSAVAIQSDGKIIIGGIFTTYNGTAANRLARINTDGTLDNSFTAGTGPNSTVFAIAIQNDGKIIIGGPFNTYNGTAANRLARINTDGTLDNSFTVGAGPNTTVNTVAIQSDGKIIIGGLFTTYNGTAATRFARINTDGILDNTFNTATGANSTVNKVAIHSDGKIIIVGAFTTYKGISRNGITRIVSCAAPLCSAEINVNGNAVTIVDGDAAPAAADHTDFGNAATGGNIVRTFTIENTGITSLTVTGITMTGADAAMFTAGALTPASPIAAGGSATFIVTFTPTATGLKTATVNIANNDCDEAAYDFAVQGTGIAATPGAALDLDGVDDYITVPYNAALHPSNAITMEAWVRPQTGSGAYARIADNEGAQLIVGNNLYPRWQTSVFGALVSPAPLTAGSWHHIAGTYDGSMVKLYVDGILVASNAATGTFPTSSSALLLGLGFDPYYFQGQIDEFRLWNVARNCEEIKQYRNCELTGSETGLVAYYKFNQGDAGGNNAGVTTLTDATANTNHGALNNFALTGTTSNWVAPGGVTPGVTCGAFAAPEINVEGNGITIVDGNATPSVADHTDFGNVNTGNNSVRTFTIQNTGTADLTVTGITMTGADAAMFTAGALTPASPIAAGGSTTFTVTFTPTSAGLKTATVNIANNDCDEAAYDFAVQGTGLDACPTPTITANGPATFCLGASVELSSSSATGNQWYLDGSPVSGATDQNYLATVAGDYTVVVTGGTCSSSAPSAPITVTVNPIPATPTISASGSTTFCAGGSVTLTSSSSTGNQWYESGSPISGETSQTYSATTSGSYTVIVTSLGCASAASASTVVTVNAIPATPTISANGPTTFCTGGSVTLTSSSSAGNQWYESGNPISGATNQTYVVTTSGSYTVVITSLGCTSAASAPTAVTVNPIPATPTISTSGSTTFCTGGSVTLTSSSASGNQWYKGGVLQAGETNQTYSATTSGSYTVVVTSLSCASVASAPTAVTVNPAPSITLGVSPTVTGGTTTANLPYTATSGTPDQYNIDYDAAANTAGFADVVYSPLPASPVILTVPGSAPVGIYNATITVKNSITGCTGNPVAFTVTVTPAIYTFTGPGLYTIATHWSPSYPGVNIAVNAVVIINGPCLVNVPVSNAGSFTVNGALENNSIFTNSGSFTNSGTYKGTGTFTGSVFNNAGGNVAPGASPGCMVFLAGFNQGGGTETIEIGGTTSCTQHDQLNVTGTTTLSGMLNVALVGGFVPSCNQRFTIMTNTGANPVLGTFATVNYPALPAGLAWRIIYNAPSPGDVTVFVDNQIAGDFIGSSNSTICANQTTNVNINLTGLAPFNGSFNITLQSGSGVSSIYNWTAVSNGLSAVTIPAANLANTGFTNTTYLITWSTLQDANPCTIVTAPNPVLTGSVLITVEPRPDISAVPGNTIICNGTALNIIVTNPNAVGGTYTRTGSYGPVLHTAPNPPQSGQAYGVFTDVLTNPTPVPQVVTYTFTPDGPGTVSCPGAPVTVNIIVTPAPTISCVADQARNTNSNMCTYTAVGTEFDPPASAPPTCSGVASVLTYTSAANAGPSGPGGVSPASGTTTLAGAVFNKGVTTITWRIAGGIGNTAICSFTVTVSDVQTPTITCPGNQTLFKSATTCATVLPDYTGFAIATDNCSPVTKTQSPVAGTTFAASETDVLVTITATDPAGNSSSCSFTVFFVDNTAPVFTSACPITINANTVAGNTNCYASVTAPVPTATDNCTAGIGPTTITYVIMGAGTSPAAPTSGTVPVGTRNFNLGTTTITYTATDASGNTATCVHTITVTDNSAPTITCPATVNANTGAGNTQCSASVTSPDPVTFDNCGVTSLTWVMTGATTGTSPATGINNAGTSVFNVGTTTVTYTVRDASNNTNSCSYSVVVADNTTPTINCPANITRIPNAPGCISSVATPNPVTGDNCGVTTLTWSLTGATTGTSPASGINNVGTRNFNVGVTTVTYTVSDAAGNSATCSYTVTINKNLSATICCNATVPQNTTTTSPITFTGAGGTVPYTFIYDRYVNAVRDIVGPYAVTTAASNPPYTVAQSNAVTGVFRYVLLSVTDTYGCTGTIPVSPLNEATITVVPGSLPDLTSSLILSSSQLSAGGTIHEVISIRNIGTSPATGQIVFKVTNYPAIIGMTAASNNNPTVTIGGTTYNLRNVLDWDVTSSTSALTFTSKPGVFIPAGGSNLVGITIIRAAAPNQGSNGTANQTIMIQPGTGGGETPTSNNSQSTTFLKN